MSHMLRKFSESNTNTRLKRNAVVTRNTVHWHQSQQYGKKKEIKSSDFMSQNQNNSDTSSPACCSHCTNYADSRVSVTLPGIV